MTETKKPHYYGHRQRLKAKLVRDSRSLADYEVLELALALVLPRRDTKPLAKELIERFGSLKDALMAHPDQLEGFKGVADGVKAQWILNQELFARISEASARRGETLSDPARVAEIAIARIGNKNVEEFWAAFLDSKNRIIVWEQVSKGTADGTPVFPRDIAATALKHEATGIILVHNHPGGDPTPSMEDIRVTNQIRDAVEALSIRVLDHFVVTDHDYYSFSNDGRL
jgi:DNA repair protein RadC